MKQSNWTTDHIKSDKFADESPDLPVAEFRRQGLQATGGHTDVGEVTGNIAELVRQGVACFPDSNIAIKPELEPLWRGIQHATSGQRSCYITAPVLHELKEWLGDPYRRQAFAGELRSALAANTWLHTIGVDNFDEQNQAAMWYYTQLLWARRKVALPTEDGRSSLDGQPYDRKTILSQVERAYGLRAMRIAKKGLQESRNGIAAPANDELHVLLGFMLAIKIGRPIAFVTTDFDIYEQFYKLQYLLDTHYRSWCVGLAIQRGQYEPMGTGSPVAGYWPFDGDIELYRRKSDNFREVLPDDFVSVPVTVIYLQPSRQYFHQMTTFLVRDLNGMLWTKAITGGNSTAQFGSRNVHIELGPLGREFPGAIGVTEDLGVPTDHFGIAVALHDYTIAFHSQERHSSYPLSEDD